MYINVTRYEGGGDGLRYGQLRFDRTVYRHFLFDRLSGRVRLFETVGHDRDAEDEDPRRRRAAEVVLKGMQ